MSFVRQVFKTRTFARWSRKALVLDAVIGTNRGTLWVFLFGFEKNERSTIDDRELLALQKTAAVFLAMKSSQLECAVEAGELTEICHEEKPNSK